MEYLKKLAEQRDEKTKKMQELMDKAKAEERALTEEENAEFERLEKEISGIDKTVKAEKRSLQMAAHEGQKSNHTQETQEEAEERAFLDCIMAAVENRSGEQNLATGTNGSIIPTSIANRIIKAIKDRSPILQRATVYNVKGTLKIPVWGDADGHNIKVAFVDEFQKITADAGKFTSVDLTGYMFSALTLIGRQLENNASFSVVDFVINQMAEEIAIFLEGKLLNGEASKMEGALATKTKVTTAASSVLTADELIDVQSKIKQVYQGNACWIMHSDTFAAIRKLKDGNNRYLLQDDVTQAFPYRLLGKPVFLSDNMPKIATSAKVVLYGDMSGLSVNIRQNLQMQVLREKYSDVHAIGIQAWMEADSKVTDHQRLAVLEMSVG